jgi:thiamine transporter
MEERLRGPRLSRLILEAGIAMALAFILSFLKICRMPQGGEVSPVMVPLILFALLRGPVPGFLAGMGFGFLHFLQSLYIVHPLQFLLDYPLSYSAAGLAGFWGKEPLTHLAMVCATLSSMAGRFFFHTLSGTLFLSFFLHQVPGSPLLYAALYNASYIVPDTVIALAVVPLIAPRLRHAFS